MLRVNKAKIDRLVVTGCGKRAAQSAKLQLVGLVLAGGVGRRQLRRDLVIACVPRDLFDQVLFSFGIDSPTRNDESRRDFAPAVFSGCTRFVQWLKAETFKNAKHLGQSNSQRSQRFHPREMKVNATLRQQMLANVDRIFSCQAPGNFANHFNASLLRSDYAPVVRATFEPS